MTSYAALVVFMVPVSLIQLGNSAEQNIAEQRFQMDGFKWTSAFDYRCVLFYLHSVLKVFELLPIKKKIRRFHLEIQISGMAKDSTEPVLFHLLQSLLF